MRKKFALIPKDPDAVDMGTTPSEVSYVFGGAYTPFIAKLVANVLQKKPVEESLNAVGVNAYKHDAAVSARPNASAVPNTAVVVFLGGCTHTEVNALRFIGRQLGYRFVVVTTAVVTAHDVLSTMTVDPL